MFPSSNFTYDFHDRIDVTGEYDLIFVDFDNGTDFIQRNAFVVDGVIRWVNSVKANFNGVRQQNVIMGMSMGGLVTRYALRDMENNSIVHECRLFISDDAPQNGANVPVGIQMAAHHLGGVSVRAGLPGLYVIPIIPSSLLDPFSQIRTLQALSETPAAKQMLIQRVTYNSNNNISGMYTISKTEHQNFQNEIDLLGWPTTSRNIAVSNGICSNTLVFPDNDLRIFTFSGNRPSTYFGQLWQSAAASFLGIYTNIGTFWQFPLSIISTKTSLNVDIWSNAVPPNFANQQIYNGDIFIKRKILFLINVNTYLTKSKGYSGTTSYALDNSPGGVYNLSDYGFSAAALTAQLPNFISSFVTPTINHNTFSFVPRVSSLNASNPFSNLRTNICSNNLICESKTNFQAYFVSNTGNENHISFNRPNAEFIFNEMQGIATPLPVLQAPTITRTYETEDCSVMRVTALAPLATCYDWEVTSGDLLINGLGTSLLCSSASVTVSTLTGLGGNVRVRAHVGQCLTEYTNICFTPCLPWTNANFRFYNISPTGSEPLTAEVDAYPDALYYQWFINGQLIETTYTPELQTYQWLCSGNDNNLTVFAITNCGRTDGSVGGTYSPICNPAKESQSNIVVYPNPSSSKVNVSIKSEYTKPGQGKSQAKRSANIQDISEIKIIDKFGLVKKVIKYSKGSKNVQVNLIGIVSDVYYLEISDGVNTTKMPLIIKKLW